MDDSDSDLDTDVQTTTVLLGYADPEPTGDDKSHLGGSPTWLIDTSPADARLAKCGCCNKLMSLLLQLDGEVPQSPHKRVFYVWACREKTCRRKKGSVRAIRGVRVIKTEPKKEVEISKPEEKNPLTLKPAAGDLLFGGTTNKSTSANPVSMATTTANPFSINDSSENANPFSPKPAAATTTSSAVQAFSKTFADTLRISSPPVASPAPEPLLYGSPEPWPSNLPHQYPHFYLDAENEQFDPEPPAPLAPFVTIDDSEPSAPSAADTTADSALDLAFQKFADRVSQNPEQVLRYERDGQALLYSYDDETGKLLKEGGKKRLPSCGNCGRRDRVFEFQLMPHAISVLEGEEVGLEGMEWGTIIVGTCLCVPKMLDKDGVGWVEEWVGVQWEGQR